MRILHYSLGFPPYRTGGLTKFCMDLMTQQHMEGHEVSLFWPGQMQGKQIHIKKRHEIYGIGSFEMINPLPVSLDEGISEIEAFTKYGDVSVFLEFFKRINPDVIHIHTFMGLYAAFLDAAEILKIKTVYTTHDFFPICPKVTMYRHGKICNSVTSCVDCPKCNSTALGIKQIRIMQSVLYRNVKNMKIIAWMRKKHRDAYLQESILEKDSSVLPSDYLELRSYYEYMINKIDIIHYNSSVAKLVYNKFFSINDYRLLSITHSAIKNNKRTKTFNKELLRIRYLGPQSGVKGFLLLKKTLDELWKERQDFCLDVHFPMEKCPPYVRIHKRYVYEDLEKIFDETDVLVVPSIWYETFGYTVLEALSYGVPVIISGTVGAKDILADGCGIVINDISVLKLLDVLKKLNCKRLKEMNDAIVRNQHILEIDRMAEAIMMKCYGKDC